MDLILGVVLIYGAIGTLSLFIWDTFQNLTPITKAELQLSYRARPEKQQKREECYFTEVNYG